MRDQAIRLCAAAERIAAAMARRPHRRGDGDLVRHAIARSRPSRSSSATFASRSRGVAGAEETLRRVEEQNLPLLESRFDALYDQLHRGEIVDLAVASEMLDLDLPEPPPAATMPVLTTRHNLGWALGRQTRA